MTLGNIRSKIELVITIPRLKPYFKEDGFVLYRGDALKLIRRLPEESVDMIFADPPYRLSNDGFTCHAGKRASVNKGKWDQSKGVEEDFQFHFSWIASCRAPLKRNGAIWISGTLHSIYQCGYALQLGGYKILNDIAWYKPNAPPHLAARYFAHSHETLLWARKFKNARHTFHYRKMKESDWPEDFLKKPGRQMRSVWAINTPPAEEKVHGKHPTQKPLALMVRIILACTNPGDLVLDPFTGSSTTGLACWLTKRQFIGIDVENEYLDLSIKRLRDIQRVGGVRTRRAKRKGRRPQPSRGQVPIQFDESGAVAEFMKELEDIRKRAAP